MGRGDRVTHTLPRLVAEFSTEDTLALAAEAVHAANENHRVMFCTTTTSYRKCTYTSADSESA
jgi:hypothetical protein